MASSISLSLSATSLIKPVPHGLFRSPVKDEEQLAQDFVGFKNLSYNMYALSLHIAESGALSPILSRCSQA
jgi:hypothetical protein